ncbi:hypothetical protein [Muriicola sp. Z0-33]|uniref:hypothetical protein n=1 Tax=Muriicola sp. Z0-33 TaxID=2816957 RepID=UPI00223850E6|nr:hypothetical protein [Muriicola sp. Z0-33]MCW5515587.1 hypothetical protein [Muriicola sp. Z0-33]
MTYIVIFGLTLLSCFIFDNLGMAPLIRDLTGSYKSQFQVMQNKELTDEEKQKVLLQQVSKQLGYLLKLIGSILLFVAPFGLIFLLEQFIADIHSDILYTLNGILLSLLAVVFYIAVKKLYVKLFKSREASS